MYGIFLKFIKDLISNKILKSFGIVIFKYKSHYHYVKDIYGKTSNKQVDFRSDKNFYRFSRQVISQGKTSHYYDRLHSIYQLVSSILASKNRKSLTFLEVGVYKGGTVYFTARLIQNFKRKVTLYAVDTFEGHSKKDIPQISEGVHSPGKFSDTNIYDVKKYLSPFKFIRIIEGRIQDVINKLPTSNYDFIHLDIDIYTPTFFCLNYFANKLNPGAILLIDDYNFISCPGVKKAALKFLKGRGQNDFFKYELSSGQYILIRK